jgi:hypothetical protein
VVKLDFAYFNTQSNRDVLRIYDGNTTNDRLIAALSGSIEIPLVIESTRASVLIEFDTDYSTNYEGFSLSYSMPTSGMFICMETCIATL